MSDEKVVVLKCFEVQNVVRGQLCNDDVATYKTDILRPVENCASLRL